MSEPRETLERPSSPTYHEAVATAIRPAERAAPPRTWRTDFTFSCDETGNTGPQFYAPDQPLYVEPGWLMHNSHCDPLASTFAEIGCRHGVSPKTKCTRLKDHARGRECMMEALALIAQSAVPFL